MNESIPGGNAVMFGSVMIVVAVMMGLVVYVLLTTRRRGRMGILQQIVNLDKQFEKGKIDANEHQASRKALTARALAVMDTEAHLSEGPDQAPKKEDSFPG